MDAPGQGTTLTNTATITSTTSDPDPSNNTDSSDTTVDPSADLAVTKTAPANVTAGGTITYTVDAANNGPSNAANVTVTDTLPAGVTFVSVNASNGGWTCNNTGNVSVTCTRANWNAGASTTFTIIVDAPGQGGTITNTATISSTTPDPDTSNNTDTADTIVDASADLAITKTGPAAVTAGGTITYTLDATNNGPSDAANVTVTDTLPVGVTFVSVNASNGGWTCNNTGNVSVTCTRANWNAGAATTFTIVVDAPSQDATVSNVASLTSDTPDPDPSNDTDSVDTIVGAAADLAIAKRGPAEVEPGATVQYRLQVTNNGSSDAQALHGHRHPSHRSHLRLSCRNGLDLHQRREHDGDVHTSVAGRGNGRTDSASPRDGTDSGGTPDEHGDGRGDDAGPGPVQRHRHCHHAGRTFR